MSPIKVDTPDFNAVNPAIIPVNDITKVGKEPITPDNSLSNDINVVNGYDTKVMILDSGMYLNVDKKTKISSKLNCQ